MSADAPAERHSADAVVAGLVERGLTVATAESLTAGLIAATLVTCLLYTSDAADE